MKNIITSLFNFNLNFKLIRVFLLLSLILFYAPMAQAQQKAWQWIKSGGAKQEGSYTEAIQDIATDSDRNVYITAPMGKHDLYIDGMPQNYYGGAGGNGGEWIFASFGCDGIYRWSKIIGGKNNETPFYVENDGNDNFFLAGKFTSCDPDQPGEAPARIENDFILDQSSTHCSLLVIAKYDKNGNLLWYRQPQDPTNSSNTFSHTRTGNISVDASGNLYWLVNVPQGSYANGAFVNTLQGVNLFVFKYSPSGNFISATHLNSIEFISGGSTMFNELKMYRNAHNGFYYLTGVRTSNDVIKVNGQDVTGSLYLACYDDQGNFQWMRENTYNSVAGGTRIFGLEFDHQNNIYMGGKFIGFSSDVFLGQSVPEQTTPHFVIKTNPDATNVSWFSYSSLGGASSYGGFTKNNNTTRCAFRQY